MSTWKTLLRLYSVILNEIRSTLYPDTKFYKLPKIVFVDSLQNGYLEGVLPNGSYTLVKIARKPLPSPKR